MVSEIVWVQVEEHKADKQQQHAYGGDKNYAGDVTLYSRH